MRGALYLHNTGVSALEFSITGSCGCSELDPTTGTIAAGHKVPIAVGVELPNYANSERSVELITKWSRPGNSESGGVARCVVQARCPAPFETMPPFVNLGALTLDEVSQASATMRVAAIADGHAFHAERLQIENESRIFRAEKAILPDAAEAVVTVTLASNVPVGEHYDTIVLKLENSDHATKVPVRVHITDRFSVVPATAYVRADSVNGGFRPVDIFIVSRPADAPVGALKVVEGPIGVRIEELESLGTTRRRARLHLTDVAPWEEETLLRLGFDGQSAMASIKLFKQNPKQ
jgi:hypothetical protein